MPRHKNRLLNQSDHCLILQPSLVQAIGKSATLFLQQVHYSLTHPNFGREIEGCRWVHHTLEEWIERIKIFSKSTLKRSIAYLKEKGILLIEKLSFKKSDRTNWYSINYEALSDLLENSCKEEKRESEVLRALENEAPKDQNQELKMSPSSAQNEPMYNTEITYRKNLNINLNKSEDCFIDEKNLKKGEDEREGREDLKKPSATDLLEIWNQETNQNVVMTKERARHLMAVLQRCFNTSKEEWRNYCKTIMSSDYLSGKTYHKFDLRLDWALKFQTVQKIKEKAYGVKDIPQSSDAILKTIKDQIHKASGQKEKEIRELLVDKFGLNTYKSWFETLRISSQNDLIIFKTESLFVKNYLERAFKYPLQDILKTPFEII